MNNLALSNMFLARQAIEGVQFGHNDYVRVISGKHTGNCGSLVGILQMVPEPEFILESETGIDLEVLQSDIELFEKGS